MQDRLVLDLRLSADGEVLTVMRRVFEGGVGSIRPGRSERSSDREDGDRRVFDPVLDVREMGGVVKCSVCIVGDAVV